MCNSFDCQHGLDDDISDLLGGGESVPAPRPQTAAGPFERKGDSLLDAGLRYQHEPRAAAHGHRYEEACPKCGGSGQFRGYSGISGGRCFTCKGVGKLTFKTSPEARAKAAADREARRDREAKDKLERAGAWLAANPDEAEWLRDAAARGFEFAQSMVDALRKYGALTERQEAAVRNATAKSLARKAQWAAEKAERDASASVVDITKIATALATAKGNGLKFPKLRLAGFVFSLAPDTGRNAGAIYVKNGEDYLGKIADARFFRSRECSAELEGEILKAAADPLAAATAYGLQTGICACCGRELTNAESVKLGIGPICREKFGWA